MINLRKVIAIGVLSVVASYVFAQGVYQRETGSSSAQGAATYTYSGNYTAFKINAISVIGLDAGATNLIQKVTKDNVYTQTVATVTGNAYQATIASPYMTSGDKLVFSGNATNFNYMIEGEVQRR